MGINSVNLCKKGVKVNKMGKVIRTICYCGRVWDRASETWVAASKHRTEYDKKLAEQGHLQNKLILCDECGKGRLV